MKKFICFILSGLILCACSPNQEKKDRRADYSKALNDSVELIKTEIDSCNSQISILGDQVGVWLRDFTNVNNPREVEGYTIFNGWEKNYPLQSTGLIARITENEQLELIAALKGGIFDRIEVSVPEQTVSSATVPHDQALNYRREGLTTVMFSGGQTDTIAHLIADNELNIISVSFFQGDKKSGSWQMPANFRKMISATWMLYSSRSEQTRLERRVVMLNEKMKLLREHLNSSVLSPDEQDEEDRSQSSQD